MSINERRVFQYEGTPWVAQIISSSGRGTVESRPRTTHETVAFTPLSEEQAETRQVVIPVGVLNRMSYKSLVAHLLAAEPYGGRLEPKGIGKLGHDEIKEENRFRDDGGLEWAFRDTHIPEVDADGRVTLRPAVEFRCLDDSAMRRDVFLGGALHSSLDIRQGSPVNLFPEIAKAVKDSFQDVALDG